MRLDALKSTELLYVTGKGGVGKSTISAALAAALARLGRRVLLVETDTYSAATDLLGADLPDHAITNIRENLDAINMRADEAFVETVKRFLPSERLTRAITQNRVARVFFRAAPSVNEFVLLDRIVALCEDYEHVVVDLPASGHAVTFLNVPSTLFQMIKVGPVAELAKTMADRHADARRTGIVAVCLPEEMPVNETVELAEKMETTLDRPLSGVILNMVHEPPMNDEQRVTFERMRSKVVSSSVTSQQTDDDFERIVVGNSLVLDWFDRDHKYIQILRDNLPSSIPLVQIPMFYESDGESVVERSIDALLSDPEAEDLAS